MQQATSSSQTGNTIPACEPFPYEGNVRAKQSARHLGIGLSTFWLYVKTGRINAPVKYSKRCSVWSASYIRGLAINGIPEAEATK